MNDEIKSFLVNIKGNEEWKQIYDYITNLQQENERLKEYYNIIVKFNEKNIDRYCDYYSRCEKAIEYIKYNDDSLYTYEPDYDYEENLVDNYEISNFREDLLNILQNGSENDDR